MKIAILWKGSFMRLAVSVDAKMIVALALLLGQ